MKIAILTPTRNRPDGAKRLVKSGLDTAKNRDNITFYFYVDNDDHSYDGLTHERVKWVRGERIVLSAMWNKCYEQAVADGNEIFMHCGDDIVFQSKDWDEKVEAAINSYPDRIVLVHGEDGFWHERFGTHCWVHRNWIDATGRFLPPYFSSDWNDTWLNDLANAINRRIYLPDVVTEHMHYVFGKAPKDATYQERENRGARDNVGDLYRSKQPERDTDVEKLRAYIGGFNKQ